MHPAITLSTLPLVLLYFGYAVLAYAVFTFLYTRMTPHDDFKMIRSGSAAASLGLASAWIGFGLPLSVLVFKIADFSDLILWTIVAMAIQYAAFLLARLILAGAVIEEGRDATNMGHAIMVGGINVSAGLISAACLL